VPIPLKFSPIREVATTGVEVTAIGSGSRAVTQNVQIVEHEGEGSSAPAFGPAAIRQMLATFHSTTHIDRCYSSHQ